MRSLPILIAASVLLGACSSKTGREHVRGRLRCVQYSVPDWRNYGSNVDWELLFEDREVDMARRTSVCRESPDPDAELLVLKRDAVRVVDGKPTFTELHADPEYALWACDGHCMVYKGGGVTSGIDDFDTGTFTPFPRLLGQPLSLAPDRQSVVVSEPTISIAETETTLHFCVLDLKAETALRWSVPRSDFPWLERCPDSIGLDEFGDCLGLRGAKFEWTRGPSGRDVLVPPASPASVAEPRSWPDCGPPKP